MTYWIVVGTPENFEIAEKRKFDLVGFKSTRRSESAQMEIGDKLIFYLTGVKQFGGMATKPAKLSIQRKSSRPRPRLGDHAVSCKQSPRTFARNFPVTDSPQRATFSGVP